MIEFELEKVSEEPLEKIVPNSWNPKHENTAEYRKIRDSIEREGQKVPIVVRQQGKKLEIIDGQQRWTAMRELKKNKIWVNNRGEVSDEDAMNETLWYQHQVPMILDEAAKLTETLKAEGLETAFDFSKIEEFDTITFETPNIDKKQKEKQNGQLILELTMERTKYDYIIETLEEIQKQNELDNISEAIELVCVSYQKETT